MSVAVSCSRNRRLRVFESLRMSINRLSLYYLCSPGAFVARARGPLRSLCANPAACQQLD